MARAKLCAKCTKPLLARAVRAWAGQKGRIDARKKPWQQQQPQGAGHSIFFAPLLSDLQRLDRLLFSISISLNHPPRGNSSATPTHDSTRNADQKVVDPRLRRRLPSLCSIRPSVHPACSSLQPPCSEPLSPNSHVQRRQRGLASVRNRGTQRGRDNSSGRNLALLLRPRCLGITGPRHRISPRANTKREGGIPGPCFAADVLQHRIILGLASGLAVFFPFE